MPPAPKPPPARMPDALAAISGTLGVLADPALITTDRWQSGGVEIVLANENFATLTGYALDQLTGRNTRLLHGERTALLALGAAKGAAAARLVQGEGWLYRQDGREFYAAWSFSPILEEGRPTGFLFAIYRDISEAKHLQEALLHSQKLDTVGLLASGVAHDFNNLLSVINGYCEIMTAKIAGVPAAQKDLQEIHRAGLKAAAIARQILEFSRRQETEIKVINFNTLIREIAEILRRVAGDEIALELRLASDLSNARMDPTQFHQILLNLCFNARDAMPHGGKLCIRTYNHRLDAVADRLHPPAPTAAAGTKSPFTGRAPGLYAVMRVSDTGPGMAPAVRDSIFEPFYTTKPQGTGLGLATVLGIVRQHDGHIAVESEPGRGTTFEVFMPETAEPEETAPTKLGALPSTRGSESLLIVEPDDVLRKMIAGILATDGYQVVEVATPEQAAELVAGGGPAPQLVITNCSSRAAVALMKKMLAANSRLRLVCTSQETPAKILPAFPAKAWAHLPKPFALSTLLRTVRALLDAGGH
ncbi:MAG: ATP-binding protein [Lacunisphaera sp.]|nr:ATP-binding protein [Lacunisphaera sp.]